MKIRKGRVANFLGRVGGDGVGGLGGNLDCAFTETLVYVKTLVATIDYGVFWSNKERFVHSHIHLAITENIPLIHSIYASSRH